MPEQAISPQLPAPSSGTPRYPSLRRGRIRLQKWVVLPTGRGRSLRPAWLAFLFVAVSLRTGIIARSQELRNRAAQTLALFVTALFIAILLSIPGQVPPEFSGSNSSRWPSSLESASDLGSSRQSRSESARRSRACHRPYPARCSDQRHHFHPAPHRRPLLVFDVSAGLDALVLPVLVALAGGVTSAWLLLTKIPE